MTNTMTPFYKRTETEQNIIGWAYWFEIEAIKNDTFTRNPWYEVIHSWSDGAAVWEAIDEALSMALNN